MGNGSDPPPPSSYIWISPQMTPVGLGVSESLVGSPKEKDLRPWGWLSPAALGASPSDRISPGGSLTAMQACPDLESTRAVPHAGDPEVMEQEDPCIGWHRLPFLVQH